MKVNLGGGLVGNSILQSSGYKIAHRKVILMFIVTLQPPVSLRYGNC